MIVDLYLPCIQVDVTIYPSDPNHLTDLEAATLYFILSEDGKAQASQVAEFLRLSDAIVDDMLIRMVNRGWVSFASGNGGLSVSNKARDCLDASQGAEGDFGSGRLRSSEEGKPVTVCYDPIGGEFFVIDRRFLSRRHLDERAVPPSAGRETRMTHPYGLALDPFEASSEKDAGHSVVNRILSALNADSRIKANLLGSLGGTVPYVKPILARRRPVFDDLMYFQCRFEVRQGRAGDALDGFEGHSDPSESAPPVLICVEQKNPGIRRVGERLCELIVHHAVEASRLPTPDKSFLDMLQKRAEGSPAVRQAVPDALLALRRQIKDIRENPMIEVSDSALIYSLWGDAKSQVDQIASSRVNLSETKVVPPADHTQVVVDLLTSARRHALISSPRAEIESPHLKAQQSALDALSQLHFNRSAGILVQMTKGTTRTGQFISDPVAITRLETALTQENVDACDISQDHISTPFLHVDARSLLWQSGPLFGLSPISGLLFQLERTNRASSLWRLPEILTPDLGARIGRFYNSAVAEVDLAGSPLPDEVANCCDDIESLLDQLLALKPDDENRRKGIAHDLDAQLAFLDDWIETQSDSLHPLAGAAINNGLLCLFSPEQDRASLVVGLAGRNDVRGVDDLIELISQRLQRQERMTDRAGATRICLPSATAWDAAEQLFRKNFPANTPEFSLERIVCPRIPGCTSFALTGNTCVIAKDGLVNYVPTAGRKVKGTQIGLRLRGKRLRDIAVRFLETDWPGAIPAQTAAPPVEEAPRQRGSSTILIGQFVQMAQQEGWFHDGNRGAAQAKKWFADPRSASFGPTRDPVKLARDLLSSSDRLSQDCGYAVAKALAWVEVETAAEPIGGLALYAAHAEDAGDLMIASVFADDLPEHSLLRDPLVRDLALALGRRQEPVLSGAALDGILSPSRAAACLACLLMSDGLGGVLPAWLSDLPETGNELPEVTLARAVARFVEERGPVVLDFAHLASSIETVPLTTTLIAIGDLIATAQTRKDTGLIPAVNRLRSAIFENGDNLIGALNAEARLARAGATETQIRARLRSLLERCKEELGVDVLGSASFMSGKMSAKDAARAVFDKANRGNQAQYREVLVDLERGGRNILQALTKIIDLTFHELVPRYLGSSSDVEKTVKEAVRRVKADLTPQSNALLDRLRHTLHQRFDDTKASAPLQSAPWRFPALVGRRNMTWDNLRDALLKMEFSPKSSFALVVDEIIALDRSGNPNALMILEELIQGDLDDATDRDDVQKSLLDRLRRILDEYRSAVEAAECLALVLDGDSKPLTQACQAFRTFLKSVEISVGDGEIDVAILLFDDLRTGASPQLDQLEKALDAAISGEAALLERKISVGCKNLATDYFDEAMKTLSARRDAPTLLQLRQTIAFAPSLAQPVILTKSIVLDVSEGQMPQPDLREAKTLMRIFAAKRATLGWGGRTPTLTSEDYVEAVRSYFTLRPREEIPMQVDSEDALLRIRPLGRTFDAFAFDGEDGVEFVFPTSRDASIALLSASRTTARPGAPDLFKPMPNKLRQPARLLLAIYRDDVIDGMFSLPWRRLALAAGCKASERRVLALGLVARQRFPTRQDLATWWSGIDQRVRCKVVSRVLDLEDDEASLQACPNDKLTEHLRDVCLALGHFSSEQSDRREELMPTWVQAAARAWLQTEEREGIERLVSLISHMLGQRP